MGSDPIIERIKNEIDIVEYIGRFVSLRKGGKDHVGLCPFHNEKTPSFQVIPDKKFFHCFGCKASGDVIKFLMQFKGLSFPDAKAELAREIGIETREDPAKKLPENKKNALSHFQRSCVTSSIKDSQALPLKALFAICRNAV